MDIQVEHFSRSRYDYVLLSEISKQFPNGYTITSLVSCSCGDATQHRLLIVVCLNQVEVVSVGFSTNSMQASVVQRLDNFIGQINHKIAVQFVLPTLTHLIEIYVGTVLSDL